jgi:hypothetical protein
MAILIPSIQDSMTSDILVMSETHSLSESEIARLYTVIDNYTESEQHTELLEELKCILGDRKLKTTNMLSVETIDLARKAVESGKTQFVPQEVD